MNHFNAGHVFGRITQLKPKTARSGKPYCEIKLSVDNPQTGRVKIWGRVWGHDLIGQVTEHFKKSPRQLVHLSGFFAQYIKDGNTKHNFTFIKFQPDPEARPRAVFVLVGELVHVSDEAEILLRINRPGMNGHEIEENFRLFTTDEEIYIELKGNSGKKMTYQVKGKIRREDVDEEYVEASGVDKPFVEKIKCAPE